MGEFLKSIPLYWAKIIAGGLYVLLAVWVITRPREYIYRGAENKKKWRDLRLWAVFLIGIQIILYIIF